MQPLIDSHCHLDFEQFDHDREAILQHCQQLGVNDIVLPAVMASSWPSLIEVARSSTMLHLALGLHPLFMAQHKQEHLDKLEKLVQQHNPIAIGEIGLDFYHPEHDKAAQIDLFSKQLNIAQTKQLPVLLHIRKAHDPTLQLLKKIPVYGGIVHAFNGSLQQADSYQKLGFLFGVGGVISNPKAHKLRRLFAALPLSSLVLETDAPDMPLYQQHGQRNTPENIPLILDFLTEIRSESRHDIAQATRDNSRRILNI